MRAVHWSCGPDFPVATCGFHHQPGWWTPGLGSPGLIWLEAPQSQRGLCAAPLSPEPAERGREMAAVLEPPLPHQRHWLPPFLGLALPGDRAGVWGGRLHVPPLGQGPDGPRSNTAAHSRSSFLRGLVFAAQPACYRASVPPVGTPGAFVDTCSAAGDVQRPVRSRGARPSVPRAPPAAQPLGGSGNLFRGRVRPLRPWPPGALFTPRL